MGWGVSPTPRSPLTGIHFTGGWVGAYGRFGQAENLVPTGIRFRTVQLVFSRYTD